jgi:hypothetical protein
MIRPIEQRDVHGRSREALRASQPAESAADDHYVSAQFHSLTSDIIHAARSASVKRVCSNVRECAPVPGVRP